MNVLCIMKDGFEELEAVGTIALLRRAGIDVDVCTSDANKVSGRFNLTLQPVKDLKEVDPTSYDALFLPGGPHYQTLESDAYIMEILSSYIHSNKVVAAICAAPTILGRAGYLKNKNFGGTYVDRYAVIDGNIITGRSAAAVIDFAFALIEKLLGKESCDKVKASIYY